MSLDNKLCSLLLFACLLSGQSSFSTLSTRANTARESNHLTEAVDLYRRALAIQPSWAEGWFSLGTIKYDQNSYSDAAAAFVHAVQLAPGNGSALVMLGLCEFELGHDELSLRHLQQGRRIGIPPASPLRNVTLFHEGVLLQRAGKFDAAQAILFPLSAAGVQSNDLTQTLGLTALRLRKDEPNIASIVTKVGHAEWLAAQNKFEDAHAEYRTILQAIPAFPNLHLAYGRFLLSRLDTSAALTEFEQEIKNHPGSVIARLQIAAVKYRVDSAAGIPYAEAALKLDPPSPFGHYLLGLLLLDTGEYLRAIPELELARKSLAEEPGVYYALGSAYARCGRANDAALARATFQRLQKDQPAMSNPLLH